MNNTEVDLRVAWLESRIKLRQLAKKRRLLLKKEEKLLRVRIILRKSRRKKWLRDILLPAFYLCGVGLEFLRKEITLLNRSNANFHQRHMDLSRDIRSSLGNTAIVKWRCELKKEEAKFQPKRRMQLYGYRSYGKNVMEVEAVRRLVVL